MKIPFSIKTKKAIFFSLCFFVFTTCKKGEYNVYVTAKANTNQGALELRSPTLFSQSLI